MKPIQIAIFMSCAFHAVVSLCLFPPWEIFQAILSSADFLFKNQLFRKNLSGIPSECQADLIQIRPDFSSGLIWVQTVCKRYSQTPLGDELNQNFETKSLGIVLIPLPKHILYSKEPYY